MAALQRAPSACDAAKSSSEIARTRPALSPSQTAWQPQRNQQRNPPAPAQPAGPASNESPAPKPAPREAANPKPTKPPAKRKPTAKPLLLASAKKRPRLSISTNGCPGSGFSDPGLSPPQICHLDRSRTVSSSCGVERPATQLAEPRETAPPKTSLGTNH